MRAWPIISARTRKSILIAFALCLTADWLHDCTLRLGCVLAPLLSDWLGRRRATATAIFAASSAVRCTSMLRRPTPRATCATHRHRAREMRYSNTGQFVICSSPSYAQMLPLNWRLFVSRVVSPSAGQIAFLALAMLSASKGDGAADGQPSSTSALGELPSFRFVALCSLFALSGVRCAHAN